ncbi:hypothetical protein F383_04718 [Gossypium arboreum]|uniref:Uncharacterized protein n=1 Tax=Gossypium arboreum TaxID=29729 RepID=A0A0B0NWQ6_GOSAR|nr:hypothetical protein F383_04718 [Gossypium arboreum]
MYLPFVFNMVYNSTYLDRIHIHIVIHFLRMPVKPFGINKDTRIARKDSTMPTS